MGFNFDMSGKFSDIDCSDINKLIEETKKNPVHLSTHDVDALLSFEPPFGQVIKRADVTYEGKDGELVWDFGLCHEINFYVKETEELQVLFQFDDDYPAAVRFDELREQYKRD